MSGARGRRGVLMGLWVLFGLRKMFQGWTVAMLLACVNTQTSLRSAPLNGQSELGLLRSVIQGSAGEDAGAEGPAEPACPSPSCSCPSSQGPQRANLDSLEAQPWYKAGTLLQLLIPCRCSEAPCYNKHLCLSVFRVGRW